MTFLQRTCLVGLIVAVSLAGTTTDASSLQSAPGENQPGPVLTLKEALRLARDLGGSARLELADLQAAQADTGVAQARSALLPNFDAVVTSLNQTRNLAAFGIRLSVPVPGFQFPEFVGPFSSVDARATISQTIFDLSAIRRYQASRTGSAAATDEKENAGDQVTGDVARAYLAALMAQSRRDIAKANVELSEALLKLAENQKAVGTATGIDVTRARVQQANERQRLLVTENERKAFQLRLLRLIGLDLDRDYRLDEQLSMTQPAARTVEQAVSIAQESRADLKAQVQREEAVRLTYSAVKWERMPSVVGFGDYGSIGSGLTAMLPTRVYGVALRLPIFDGGRRDARRAEAGLQLRQEEVRTTDLKRQIELEVRVALDNLRSAEEQLEVAAEGLELAEAEMAQARRRFEAGVSGSLELTDAQTRLIRAQENQLNARFSVELARVDVASATGTIQKLIP